MQLSKAEHNDFRENSPAPRGRNARYFAYPSVAVLYRIYVEEKALLETLGQDYAEYGDVTKRLIPGIF